MKSRVWLVAAAFGFVACDRQTVAFPDDPVGPSPPAVFTLSFAPAGVLGGRATTGTVRLTLPAPSGGIQVVLSGGDGAAVVPPVVAVAPGADTVTFPVATTAVDADRDLVIRASTPVRSIDGVLPVWAVLPLFFSYVSEPGDVIGRGRIGRLIGTNTTFRGHCRASEVLFQLTSVESWSLRIGAPEGQPIRVGAYEDAVRIPDRTHPVLDVAGQSGCGRITGRFDVHEADISSNGAVIDRFWATFEQHCDGAAAALRGDIRVTGLSQAPSVGNFCYR